MEEKELGKINQNVTKGPSKEKKKKKYGRRLVIVLVFLSLCALYMFISLRGEYLEILEIGEGYLNVFWTNLRYEYITIGINFIILFLAIFITNLKIKKGLKTFFQQEKREFPKLPNKSIALIGGGILSLVVSSFMLEKVMLIFNTSIFGINDPIFNMDISFYVFQKPFIEFIISYFIISVIGLALYIAAYYIIVFNVYFDGVDRETLKKSSFFKQLYKNIMLSVIGIAGLALLNTQNILTDKFLTLADKAKTELYGAGLIDVSIKLWGYRILSIIMIASVYMAIRYFKKGQTKKVVLSILGVPAYLIILFVIMLGFDLMFVKSNQLDKEKKYIGYNIENTKNAYNLNIKEKSLDYSGTLTLEESENYTDVLENITIIDKDTTLKTLQEYQTSSKIYDFITTSVNKYNIEGKDEVVYISPREILNNGNRTYDNKTYEYTHGIGAVITSANQTDETGNIKYIQKSFTGEDNNIYIDEPRIYFGMQTNSTIITNAKNKTEFDYPLTSVLNAENNYDGNAGLNLGFLDRLILGIRQKDVNFAFSREVTKDSKILINRNIIQRAKKILPYLWYDDEPYMVVTNEGKLVWVLDAYTTSNSYPYSQKSTIEVEGFRRQINYIRNSIKVLIDAYDGTVSFYITDRTDPIAMAYRNIYPELFADVEVSLLREIEEQLNYPKFLYEIQSEVLAMYHNVQTDVLYRADDIWDVATHSKGKISTTTGTKINPEYTLVKADGMEESKIGLVLPYTPVGKQNIISYLVGTTHHIDNKLTLYKFSSDSNIVGPMQLDIQLEEDETISKELESLNVTGTRIVRNMIVIPIQDTILYVEPIYQVMLNESNVPILKKIVVASGNKVAIGNTLKESLTNLLSKYAVDIEVENTESIEDLIDAIIRANANLTTSNNNNDWEMVGKDIKKLQDLIDKLETVVKEEEEKNKNNTITNQTDASVNSNLINSNIINDI